MTKQPHDNHPRARSDRLANLRISINEMRYDVPAEPIAEAVVRRLTGQEVASDVLEARNSRPRIALAPQRPSTEELARAQLNRYAIDLRHSYERELRRAGELEKAAVATVRTLAMVAERDDRTGNHIQRVHDLGLLLAREVCPADADDRQLAYGLILHDIGKVAVPDAVLHRSGPLDQEERALLQTHPEIGAQILAPLPFLSRAREVVLHHHERWDGSGYPHGLSGEEIPLWARIFAVVDAVDAIASGSRFGALPLDDVLEEVTQRSGRAFDPRCVSGLLALDRGEVVRALHPAPQNRLHTLVA